MGNKHSTEHFLLLIIFFFLLFIFIATMARYPMKIHGVKRKKKKRITNNIKR